MNNRHMLPFQGWRLVLSRSMVLFSLVVLVFQLGNLQFRRGEQFVEDAEENRLQLVLSAAPRGAIYDRNRVPLANNDPAYNVAIIPALLPDDPDEVLEVYNRLSALLDIPATRAIADAAGRTNEISLEELVQIGRGIAPYQPVLVAQDIPFTTFAIIQEQRQLLPGVEGQVASVRRYPTGELTAHIVGYLGPIGPEEELRLRELGYNPAFDRIGYAGIERYFEEQMAGTRGEQYWEVDVAGQLLNPVGEAQQFEPGLSVQLTIDVELQQAAQEALEAQFERMKQENNEQATAEGVVDEDYEVIEQGVVIAMDPRNGEILAMVSWPPYDNTRFARSIDADYYFRILEDPLRPLVNHAIGALYPPGSVWKLITATGVVEEDVIDPYDNLYCAGQLKLPNLYAPRDERQSQTFVCWEPNGHREVSLIEGIAQSCDVYFYQVGGGNPDVSPLTLRAGGLGVFDLYRWATAFGIGSELGGELPGELAGRMPERQWKRRTYGESWSTGDTYNAAFGQGYVTVTPLQLLSSVAAVANGGTLYQPTIVQNLQDANGTIILDFEPRVARSIVPQPGEEVVLLLQEDMLIQGPNSLVCLCEENSPYYAEDACDPGNYSRLVDIDPNPADDVTDFVRYTVNVPYNYTFNGNVCDELEYESLGRESVNNNRPEMYQPPFATAETLELIQYGMRQAVVLGTSSEQSVPWAPPLTFVETAGKTGTAEYCDDLAFAADKCKPGQWPAHAWYVEYAPYDNPQIVVLAFVYNGEEGSAVAAPVVRAFLEDYFLIMAERTRAGQE
ncbi:MAG: hypothetical protein GYB65_01545 [Chloroflexi bacterium]|nr:hypothetical protein [Chloroflexota bacterium]